MCIYNIKPELTWELCPTTHATKSGRVTLMKTLMTMTLRVYWGQPEGVTVCVDRVHDMAIADPNASVGICTPTLSILYPAASPKCGFVEKIGLWQDSLA